MTIHLVGGPKDGDYLNVPDDFSRLNIIIKADDAIGITYGDMTLPSHRTGRYEREYRNGRVAVDSQGVETWYFQRDQVKSVSRTRSADTDSGRR